MPKAICHSHNTFFNDMSLAGKEKTSAADLVTKYDRQVEDLVLARLRPGKRM